MRLNKISHSRATQQKALYIIQFSRRRCAIELFQRTCSQEVRSRNVSILSHQALDARQSVFIKEKQQKSVWRKWPDLFFYLYCAKHNLSCCDWSDFIAINTWAILWRALQGQIKYVRRNWYFYDVPKYTNRKESMFYWISLASGYGEKLYIKYQKGQCTIYFVFWQSSNHTFGPFEVKESGSYIEYKNYWLWVHIIYSSKLNFFLEIMNIFYTLL